MISDSTASSAMTARSRSAVSAHSVAAVSARTRRRAGLARQQGHLAEELAGAQPRHRGHRRRRADEDVQRAGRDEVERVPGLALAEDDPAGRDVELLQPLRQRPQRRGRKLLEDANPAEGLQRRSGRT